MNFIDDNIGVLTSKEGIKALYHVSLYRNAVYLLLNSIATGVFGFIFWILAARFYPAEEVGLASAAIAVAGFLVTLATLGLDHGLIRYIPGSGKNYNSLVNSCFTVSVLVAITACLIFLAGGNVWSQALLFLRQNPFYISIFVIFVIAWLLYVLLHSVFVAHKRASLTLVQTLIQGFIKIGLVISLPAFFYAFGIFASWGIGFAAAVIIGLLLLIPRLQANYRPVPTIKKEVISELARFSFANYIAGLITKVPTFVLPLMVVHLLSAEQNAYFYMAYAVVSNALLLVPAGISLSLFAEGSHNEGALGTYVRKSLKFSFLILVPLIILVLLVGDKILLLFGREYSVEATKLLWVLAISSLPLTVNTIYFYMKRVEKKMKSVISLSTLTVVVALGLSYFLLPVMGIIGAGIGWVVGHGVVTMAISVILLKGRGK